MTGSARPPGWHPDETDAALLRYWDGTGWTPHTAARTQPAANSGAVASDPAVASAARPPAEPALHRTVRFADAVPEHTTVPTPPTVGGHAYLRAGGPPAVGALTAAAALVVACAALAVALLT